MGQEYQQYYKQEYIFIKKNNFSSKTTANQSIFI